MVLSLFPRFGYWPQLGDLYTRFVNYFNYINSDDVIKITAMCFLLLFVSLPLFNHKLCSHLFSCGIAVFRKTQPLKQQQFFRHQSENPHVKLYYTSSAILFKKQAVISYFINLIICFIRNENIKTLRSSYADVAVTSSGDMTGTSITISISERLSANQ